MDWGMLSGYIFALFLFFLVFGIENLNESLEIPDIPLSLSQQEFIDSMIAEDIQKVCDVINDNVFLPSSHEYNPITKTGKTTHVYFAGKGYKGDHITAQIAKTEAEKEKVKVQQIGGE